MRDYAGAFSWHVLGNPHWQDAIAPSSKITIPVYARSCSTVIGTIKEHYLAKDLFSLAKIMNSSKWST